jgi:hypothetical protein
MNRGESTNPRAETPGPKRKMRTPRRSGALLQRKRRCRWLSWSKEWFWNSNKDATKSRKGGASQWLKNWWTWSGSNRRPLPCHGMHQTANYRRHSAYESAKPAQSVLFAAKMLPNSQPAGHRADRVDQPDSFIPGTSQLSVKRGHLGRESDAHSFKMQGSNPCYRRESLKPTRNPNELLRIRMHRNESQQLH